MAQRKLLLADDSITIQKVVNLTFADEGIEVITVGDGDSAMAKMTEVAPDLVLADVNMPGLNGYQVCEKIKQSEAYKGTPVILLVGSFEPFDEAEAARVGADDFLTKPFQSIRQLVNKVAELLGSAKNGETAAAVSSFADTQEFVSPHSASSQAAAGFGDAGMDDEMIQTNNASGFALDESSKFETRDDIEMEPEAATQPRSEEDLQRFSFRGSQTEDTTAEETVYEISDEEVLSEQRAPQSEETLREIVMPQTTTVLESDDDDLLELPFEEDEDEDWEEDETPTETYTEAPTETEPLPVEAQTESQTEALTVERIDEIESVSISSKPTETTSIAEQSIDSVESDESQSASISESSAQFSPELIDAVANRVIEKLSDKVVREIAWEVVPQLADLIIKKMAEEKLKR